MAKASDYASLARTLASAWAKAQYIGDRPLTGMLVVAMSRCIAMAKALLEAAAR